MANMTERNGLVLLLLVSCQPSLNAYIFSFLFLLQFEFVLFCFFFFNFPSWYRFNFVSFSCWNLSLHIFLIIMIIMPCSGMFRDVPECSMFRVLSTPQYNLQKSLAFSSWVILALTGFAGVSPFANFPFIRHACNNNKV